MCAQSFEIATVNITLDDQLYLSGHWCSKLIMNMSSVLSAFLFIFFYFCEPFLFCLLVWKYNNCRQLTLTSKTLPAKKKEIKLQATVNNPLGGKYYCVLTELTHDINTVSFS